MGDHIIAVTIEVPDNLNGNASDLLAAFGAAVKEANHPRLASVRKKAKQFYERKETMNAPKSEL